LGSAYARFLAPSSDEVKISLLQNQHYQELRGEDYLPLMDVCFDVPMLGIADSEEREIPT